MIAMNVFCLCTGQTAQQKTDKYNSIYFGCNWIPQSCYHYCAVERVGSFKIHGTHDIFLPKPIIHADGMPCHAEE